MSRLSLRRAAAGTADPIRRWARTGLAVAVVSAVLGGLLTLPPAGPVGASTTGGGGGGCDVAAPSLSLVTFPSYADSAQEKCGLYSIEDDAIEMYAALHDLSPGSPELTLAAPEIAGLVEGLLDELAGTEAATPTSPTLTADDKGAYDWLQEVDGTFEKTAAQDALDEYHKFEDEQCNYRPPNTTLFTYDPAEQSVCTPTNNGGLIGAFTGLTPPTYAEFRSYGVYDAEETLGLAGTGAKDQTAATVHSQVVEDGIGLGAGTAALILSSVAPSLLAQVTDVGSEVALRFLNFVAPYAESSYKAQQALQQKVMEEEQGARVEEEEAAEEGGEGGSEDGDLVEVGDLDEAVDPDLADAGVDAATEAATEAGADLIGGSVGIVLLAVSVAVTEGIKVFTAAKIPEQLQANLDAADSVTPKTQVADLLKTSTPIVEPVTPTTATASVSGSGVGPTINAEDFESLLHLPDTTVGRPSSATCTTCVVYTSIPANSAGSTPLLIQETALTATGTPTTSSWANPTVSGIDTWPLGLGQGVTGPPLETVGISQGEAWTKQVTGTSPTDATTEGLTGFLPSGEINYFSSTGHPQIAFIDGDQFATLTSPGSIDAAGRDLGDDCATPGECTLSRSIVVMVGGTAQLKNKVTDTTVVGITCKVGACLNQSLVPDGLLVPIKGSQVTTLTGTVFQTSGAELYRLTLVPDTGTPAAITAFNQYGELANDTTGGPPNGGLLAGQTVKLVDPSPNPNGFSTTYTWEVETKCAYHPSGLGESDDGVPICSTGPDPPTPSALQTLSQTGVETPAFHDDPVAVLHGQTVTWTWPAPGTYHVRLITTDQDGVTHQTDENLVVSATGSPGLWSLGFAAASGTQPTSVGPSVVGPVKDGDAFTVTGCLSGPDFQGTTAYSTPKVTVDWGDGTSDSGTAGTPDPSDENLTFTYDPGGGCPTPWSFSATHIYRVTTAGLAFLQQPLTVKVSDVTTPPTPTDLLTSDTETSSTLHLGVDVYPATSPPAFVSGARATVDVTAGAVASYRGHLTGAPAATIGEEPDHGVTVNGLSCTAGLPSGTGFVPGRDDTFQLTGATTVQETATGGPGCYAVTLTATNATGTAHQTLVVDEDQAPAITSAETVGLKTGTPATFPLTATGFPAPSWSVKVTSCTGGCSSTPAELPDDLAVVYSISGGVETAALTSKGQDLAASDAGTYVLQVTASSSAGTATQTLTLTIGGLPRITSNPYAWFQVVQGGEYATPHTFTVTTSDPTAKLTCKIGSEPCDTLTTVTTHVDGPPGPGLCYGVFFTTDGNGTGTLSGLPCHDGIFTLTLKATNAVGSVTQTFRLYVTTTGKPELTIANSGAVPTNGVTAPSGTTPAYATATFDEGQSGTVTLCSTGQYDTLSLEAGSLPAGLTLAGETEAEGSPCPDGFYPVATISGTPTTPPLSGSDGEYADTFTDGSGVLVRVTFLLEGAPVITSPSTATFVEGTPGSFTVTQGTEPTAGQGGCFVTTGTLPPGLTFTAHADGTATIAGTPTKAGEYHVTVTATNCAGTSTTQRLTIDVVEAPRFTSGADATFRPGAGGTFAVTTGPGAYPAPTLTATTLPAGVTFTDDGGGTGTIVVAVGAPPTTTPASVTLTASSSAGTATQVLTLVIGTAPTITTPSTPSTTADFVVGTTASQTFAVTGLPIPSFTCTVTGAPCSPTNLPAGLTFTDDGNGTATLGGTPTAPAAAEVVVTASNGVGNPVTVTDEVTVGTAPTFAGSTTTSGPSSCSSASGGTTSPTFVAGTDGSWTLCGTGIPVPTVTLTGVTCNGAPSALPTGLTFTDNGNGSATIAGRAVDGSGTACPSGYTLTVSLASPVGTTTESLTLVVRDSIVATSAPDDPVFVAGALNTYRLTASGEPVPSFAVDPSTPLAGVAPWLTLADNGDGSATLAGTPPVAEAGTTVRLVVDETNGTAAPVAEPVTVTLSPIALTAAAPGAGDVGEPYAYQFTGTVPGGGTLTFSVTPGSTLPPGLTLSSTGTLSGTPTQAGAWPLSLTVSGGGMTVSTSPIDVTIASGADTLEIVRFRSFGPDGLGDWFVQVENTTSASIPLTGWDVRVLPIGRTTAATTVPVPLGTGTLAPGATVVVAGPQYSLGSVLAVTVTGPGLTAAPGGFEVVAPDGTVTDVAGESGAPAGLVAGTGAALPANTDVTLEDGFVRNGLTAGAPVDTADNAADFTYQLLTEEPTTVSAGPATATFSPAAQSVTLTATVDAEGIGPDEGTVSFTVLQGSTPVGSAVEAGTVSGGKATATFTLPGGTTAGTYTVQATYASADYQGSVGTATLVVGPATPAITWSPPAAVTYGTALSATQLDATATVGGTPVAGAFTYRDAAGPVGDGTVLDAGTGQSLSVTFTPTDTTDYVGGGSASTTVDVDPAPLTVTADDQSRPYGAANPPLTYTVSGFVDGQDASVLTGTPDLSTTAGPTAPVGSYPIDVTPGTLAADDGNYALTFVGGTLDVGLASPAVTWSTPVPITYGTPLPATELDATATYDGSPVPGTYAYADAQGPIAPGAVLPAGTDPLTVTFTPTDSVTYGTATASTTISVAATPPAAPIGLSTSAGPGEVALTWTAPATDDGAPVTGYEVFRGTVPGGEGDTPLATVTGTTYTDTSATPGSTYYYVVRAVNAAGTSPPSSEVVAIPLATGGATGAGFAATPTGSGWWLVHPDGGVFAYGHAAFLGSLPGLGVQVTDVVGIAATPTGNGYWLVGADGGVFAFGSAAFYGSMGGLPLNQPIVGVVPTPDGRGYWLIASDGGVFAFGDARFFGSTGSIHLNQPVVGAAPAPTGEGYWLVAADGGIFAFGAAPFEGSAVFGSAGSVHLNQPIVGMAPAPTGEGYWLVGADGGVFAFGGAPFDGSLGGSEHPSPILGLVPFPDGGYELVDASGTATTFGG